MYQSYALSRVVDGDEGSHAWVSHTGGGNIKSGDTITVTYSAPKSVGHVRYVQGNDNLSPVRSSTPSMVPTGTSAAV